MIWEQNVHVLVMITNLLERGRKKSSLVLPVDKVHQLLAKEVLQNRVDDQVCRKYFEYYLSNFDIIYLSTLFKHFEPST